MKINIYYLKLLSHNYKKLTRLSIIFSIVYYTMALLSISFAQQSIRYSIKAGTLNSETIINNIPLSLFNLTNQQQKFAVSSYLNSDIDFSNSILNDTLNNYVPLSQFIYAGQERYIMDGSLPRTVTEIKSATLGIVGGVYVGAIIFLHIHQRNAWWSGQRGNFHFEEDWVSALQADKAGHAFGGYFASYVMSEGLMASGFSWDAATLWGGIFGCAYQTYVESEDGFAKKWGFSPSDWYFDAIGPLFFLAQHHVSALQNITPKWQYVPSKWLNEPQIVRPSTFIDDYNSSTFWWSVNVYNLLSEKLKQYWLPWLNIAIGYGADAVDANKDPNQPPDQLSQRRYIVGLDYNLIQLLPPGGTFWNWLRQSLDFIKFPAPALEFTESGTRFRILYPFRFNLGNLTL
jgi:hypothetical protein